MQARGESGFIQHYFGYPMSAATPLDHGLLWEARSSHSFSHCQGWYRGLWPQRSILLLAAKPASSCAAAARLFTPLPVPPFFSPSAAPPASSTSDSDSSELESDPEARRLMLSFVCSMKSSQALLHVAQYGQSVTGS